MRIIGCDPGYKGALSLLEDGQIISTLKMPTYTVRGQKKTYDLERIKDFMRVAEPDLVAIEQVTRPGVLVGNRWFLHGLAMGFGIDVVTVVPATWKRHFHIGADKGESRTLAHSYWPTYGFDKMNKGQDGEWEAALIGLYAWEHR